MRCCQGIRTSIKPLPVHHLAYEPLLILAGTLEIDACSVHGFVAQQVGQKDQVIAPGQEVDGKQVPEGMGVDRFGIDVVLDGQFFEPLGDATWSDLVS